MKRPLNKKDVGSVVKISDGYSILNLKIEKLLEDGIIEFRYINFAGHDFSPNTYDMTTKGWNVYDVLSKTKNPPLEKISIQIRKFVDTIIKNLLTSWGFQYQ
jgi:hypothetical protein